MIKQKQMTMQRSSKSTKHDCMVMKSRRRLVSRREFADMLARITQLEKLMKKLSAKSA